MDGVYKRIGEVITALNLSQAKFAERLGVSRSGITKIVNGNNVVTEQMKASICSIFSVRKNWLENGEGEMFTTSEELGEELGKIFADGDERKKALLLAFAKLGPEEWAVLEKLVKSLKES